jgi:hypothetical protein
VFQLSPEQGAALYDTQIGEQWVRCAGSLLTSHANADNESDAPEDFDAVYTNSTQGEIFLADDH